MSGMKRGPKTAEENRQVDAQAAQLVRRVSVANGAIPLATAVKMQRALVCAACAAVGARDSLIIEPDTTDTARLMGLMCERTVAVVRLDNS